MFRSAFSSLTLEAEALTDSFLALVTFQGVLHWQLNRGLCLCTCWSFMNVSKLSKPLIMESEGKSHLSERM